MPSRSDLTVPARSTRSASRSKTPAQPSRAVNPPAGATSKAMESTARNSRTRVTKATDRRPASTHRPRSCLARVESPEPRPMKIEDEEENVDNAKRTGPPQQQQQQQAQGIAGTSHPPPSQAGSWQWIPAEDAPSAGFQRISPAMHELYRNRHDVCFEGIDPGTFLCEYCNIRARFPTIKRHWFAAIWKGEMDAADLERMALEGDGCFGSSPQFGDPSEEKHWALLYGIEIHSTVMCHFSPERQLPLYAAFASYRLHLLLLLGTHTLDSVIFYHHIFVGRAMAYGQDRPEHWEIHDGDPRYSDTLRRRPGLQGI